MSRLPLLAPCLLAAAALAGCAAAPQRDALEDLRAQLESLEQNPQMAGRAPVALAEAAAAVRAAEAYSGGEAEEQGHLIYLAERRLDIARAMAERELQQERMQQLAEARTELRLQAREAEADQARSQASLARTEAEMARLEAEEARDQAERQRLEAAAARSEADELRLQLAELQALNAQRTERGMVLSLEDVLFETGKAVLKPGNQSRLDRLADFLLKYEDRTAVIEGHTDSLGSEEYNLELSSRRAESVRAYLVSKGVDEARISALGKGEAAPVASNETRAGRQQNRRVEIIIDDPAAGGSQQG